MRPMNGPATPPRAPSPRPGTATAATRPPRRLPSGRLRRRAALREAVYVLALLLSAGCLYTLLVLLPGRLRTDELRAQRDAVAREVSHLEESIKLLERDTAALEHDRWVVERALRKRLGYLRPQERVLQLAGAR